eukprot:GDKJ01032312.1.p1 GENE.GDKJ01032312.1~~GDKJ01032312.1.p1  ORF type:complete len:305 (+),score=28.04 GDKJ01032312.1:69-983(+)
MKSLLLSSLLLSACVLLPQTAQAAARNNCRLVNEGGCVKLGNGWMEFCPSEGDERIDGADKNDRDCVSVKPFQFTEFNSESGESFVVKQSYEMDFENVGTYSRFYFTNDCSDDSIPCVVSGSSIEAIKFTVAMNTTATVQVLIDLYIFSEGGVLKYNGDEYSVDPGSFKFDMRSDAYTYVNSGCNGLSMDVQMKTLGGAVGDHSVNVTSGSYNVDGVMTSPNRYTYIDDSQVTWANVETLKTTAAGSSVISFKLSNLPNGRAFRFDPFVAFPASQADNGAAPSNFKASVAVSALLAALVGLFAM